MYSLGLSCKEMLVTDPAGDSLRQDPIVLVNYLNLVFLWGNKTSSVGIVSTLFSLTDTNIGTGRQYGPVTGTLFRRTRFDNGTNVQ